MPTTFKIRSSNAENQCGRRNGRLYIPAFNHKLDRTHNSVILMSTPGVESYFDIPNSITYEWFFELVAKLAWGLEQNGKNVCIYRDGDSFVMNVLAPNVDEFYRNICESRDSRDSHDGCIIEMGLVAANLHPSEQSLNTWRNLLKAASRKHENEKILKRLEEEEAAFEQLSSEIYGTGAGFEEEESEEEEELVG